ncbi:MAG: hemolysin family protein [Myxococcota bacterium]
MEPVITEALWILFCLVGSAFFSGAETALTSLSDHQRTRLIEEEGHRILKVWEKRPQRVLTATLIGNTLFNITAAALATSIAESLLEPEGYIEWAVPAAVGAVSFLVLTFGEVSPKAISRRFHERWARPAMWALMVPYILLWPVTFVFVKLTRGLMRMLGTDPNAQQPFVTAEEIEYLIDVAGREGSFSEDRERLLRSVFEFPDTTVRELMVPRTDIVAVSKEMGLDQIINILVECGHSRLPVYEGNIDNIVGLFYAKDVLVIVSSDRYDEFDIREFLRQPHVVPEDKRIAELLSEFQAERMHMAIVVDEFGGTAGVITLEDIVEEIFGDIQDEYDAEPVQIVRVDENTLRADARVAIDEIEDYLDMDLPDHPDYDSLGGFLMAQSGGVPTSGDEVVWEGLRFRVIDADNRKVNAVLIERLTDEELEREELVS